MVDNLPSHWLKEYPYEQSIKILKGLAKHHLEKSGDLGIAALQLLDQDRWADLCDLEVDYRTLASVDQYAHYRQALAFFQKLEPLEMGVDKEAVAFRKFEHSEDLCLKTNMRLRAVRAGSIPMEPAVASVFHTMQSKIASILGDVPSLESLKFSFGPGANTTVKARSSSPRFKLGAKPACSAELASSVSTLLAQAPQWCRCVSQEDYALYEIFDDGFTVEEVSLVNVEIHAGRLQFVPKNAKTYRSIVVEPILNSFAQKGIGTFLKERLRWAGLDLRSQTRNQNLAMSGSISGDLATIDLSSASDTISLELVAMLLSPDWFSFLSRFRTGTVEYKGETFVLQKFSSMGNGFTFELESLIFWTMALACCQVLHLSTRDVACYGDDIIIPVEAVSLLARVLAVSGFVMNNEKSFVDGPFRESCGSDWFNGFDIRPYYQKTLVSGETLFSLHNFYARTFQFEECEMVRKLIHPSLHIFGPAGYGDGHLIGPYVARRSRKHEECGWDGFLFDTLVHKARRSTRRFIPGDLALPAYTAYVDSDDPVNPYVVRGSCGYRRISIYTLARGIYL